MFTNVRNVARFDPNRHIAQLLKDNHDCRVVVFGFEPGQTLPPHTSSSTVLMYVVEGAGRFQVGEEEQAVAVGDLAICPPSIPHALAADPDKRLVVMAIIAPRP